MADHLRTELVLDAVGMAIHARKPEPGLVHHTDRGSQYTSYEFRQDPARVRPAGLDGQSRLCLRQRDGRERLLPLKTELVYRRAWPSRHELEMAVFSYLEGFYNTRRRHSRLNNLSPDDYEKMHLTQNELCA